MLADLVAEAKNGQCLHLFTELLPGGSVTLCPLPKSYRLDLQVGKCKGTPFSTKNKDLLTLIYLKTEDVVMRSYST